MILTLPSHRGRKAESSWALLWGCIYRLQQKKTLEIFNPVGSTLRCCTWWLQVPCGKIKLYFLSLAGYWLFNPDWIMVKQTKIFNTAAISIREVSDVTMVMLFNWRHSLIGSSQFQFAQLHIYHPYWPYRQILVNKSTTTGLFDKKKMNKALATSSFAFLAVASTDWLYQQITRR